MKIKQWFEAKTVILATLLTGVALVVLALFVPIPDWQIVNKLKDIGSENGLTLYLSQLSFTFITISVMSVLSDSSNIIYWENIVDRKLIRPRWRCFYAYTTFSFATVIFGGIAELMGLSVLFMLMFAFDIVILMALTFSMIDVYFRHGEKAQMLEREFVKLATTPDEELKRWNSDRAKYNRMTNGLKTNTVLALRDYDASTILENMEFYARNARYLPKTDFATIFKCVDEININDFLLFFEYYSRAGVWDGVWDSEKYNGLFGLMSKNYSIFTIAFDENIFPKFAQSMDYSMAVRFFEAYREYVIRTRDAMKATNPEYDRIKNGPATFQSREVLIRTMLEEALAKRDYIIQAFTSAFEMTNVLSNYGDNKDDEYAWEHFMERLPKDYDEADAIYSSLSDFIEIMYGWEIEFISELAKNSPVLNPENAGFSGGFLTKETDYSYELMTDDEFAEDEEEYGLDLEEDEPGREDEDRDFEEDESGWEDEDRDIEEDDEPEYGPDNWPPESDEYGYYTLAGSLNYHMSEQWGRINDGDVDPKDW